MSKTNVREVLEAIAAQEASSGKVASAPAPDSASGASNRGVLHRLQTSRLAYDRLRKSVQDQLRDLEQSILAAVQAHNRDESREDEFDEADVASAVKQVYAMLDRLDGRLIDKLDQALSAKDEAREAFHAEAAVIVKQYQQFVATDPMLKAIDENGFATTNIRASVEKTLADLAEQL